MSDIVADAKAWLAEQLPRVSTHSENCHQWHDECLVARLVAAVERHRMTPEERRMSASAADFMSDPGIDPQPLDMSAEINALLGYLDRTTQKEVGRE